MAFQSYSGEVRIESITIRTSTGRDIDIKELVDKTVIFESLFESTLRGSLYISDGAGLIESGPITGAETIIIAFKNPEAESLYILPFRIVNVLDRKPMEGARLGMNYILSIVSEEQIKSASQRISKAYKGNIGQIINDIYREYLRIEKRNENFLDPNGVNISAVAGAGATGLNDLVYYESEFVGFHKFVVPNWTPLETINHLLLRAVNNQGKAANYFFFETLQGFRLKSLDGLMRNRLGKRIYKYEIKNLGGPNKVGREMLLVNDFQINSSFPNPLQGIQDGLFAGTLLTHDIVRKKIEKTTYDYSLRFYDSAHTGDHPFINVSGEKLFKKNTCNIHLYPKHKNLHSGKETVDSNHAQDWVLNRRSLLKQIMGIQITLKVPGHSDTEVGNVIGFDLHTFAGSVRVPNPWLSGDFLLGQLIHEFNDDKYFMTMTLYKDGFETSTSETIRLLETSITPSEEAE